MARIRMLGAVVAALVTVPLIGGCSHLANPSPTLVTGSSSPSTAAEAAGTSTPSASPTPIATTPPAPIAPPITYSGSGDDNVLAITKPAGATTVVATITGNSAAKNFDVRGIDGEQDHLVATTSPYHGSVLVDGKGGNTTQLRVHAFGPWTITLSDPRSAPVLGPTYSGAGDTVLLYVGQGGSAVIEGGASGTPFRINVLTAGRLGGPLVQATAPYSGVVRWPGGSAVVQVSAIGSWSIGMH